MTLGTVCVAVGVCKSSAELTAAVLPQYAEQEFCQQPAAPGHGFQLSELLVFQEQGPEPEQERAVLEPQPELLPEQPVEPEPVR